MMALKLMLEIGDGKSARMQCATRCKIKAPNCCERQLVRLTLIELNTAIQKDFRPHFTVFERPECFAVEASFRRFLEDLAVHSLAPK